MIRQYDLQRENRIALSWKEQEERIDRLLKIIEATNFLAVAPGLLFVDVVIFTCQSLWHLKDWVLADPEFGAQNPERLKQDIHSAKCLLVCADIANRSKHYGLSSPKTNTSHFRKAGINVGPGIFQEYLWVISEAEEPPYHGMEIREFLQECRAAWRRIIDTHYLSNACYNPSTVPLDSVSQCRPGSETNKKAKN